MADRFPGKITIGGDITESQLKKLAAAAVESNVKTDWGDRELDETDVKQIFYNNQGSHVTFVNEEARSGVFESLEDYCDKAGISYVRHSSPKYEYDGELSWNVPGASEDETKTGTCLATESGSAVVLLSDIEAALGDDAQETRKKLVRLVAKHKTPVLPPVIVGD
jgi:hypothetical protein